MVLNQIFLIKFECTKFNYKSPTAESCKTSPRFECKSDFIPFFNFFINFGRVEPQESKSSDSPPSPIFLSAGAKSIKKSTKNQKSGNQNIALIHLLRIP